MNNRIRISRLLVVSLLFLHLLGGFDCPAASWPLAGEIDAEGRDREVVSPAGFQFMAAQSESAVNIPRPISFPTAKSHFGGFSACLKSINQQAGVNLVRQAVFYEFFPVQFRNIDMIYPFNTFW